MKNMTMDLMDKSEIEIGVEDSHRAEVAKGLSTFLASTYTLYMKSLYYHWNVTGANFRSLHELFEDQYTDLSAAGDTIAERVRALGHFTPGTFAEFAKLSMVIEDTALPTTGSEMVQNLLHDHETCSLHARHTMKVAEKAEDAVTTDLMVERMAIHDEAAWMLRSIAQ